MISVPKALFIECLQNRLAPSRRLVIETNSMDVKFAVCILALNDAVTVSPSNPIRSVDALEILDTSAMSTKSSILGNIVHGAEFPVPWHVKT